MAYVLVAVQPPLKCNLAVQRLWLNSHHTPAKALWLSSHHMKALWLSSHHSQLQSFGYPANKKIPAYSYGYHSPIFSSHRSCPWKSTAGPYLIKFWLLLFLFLLSIFSRVRSRPLQTHGFLQLSAVFPWQPKVLQKIWVHS